MKRFEDVRNWAKVRGIGSLNIDENTRMQSQYQRVLQEVVEIHDAMVIEDHEEFIDAIGDTIVTLVNLANMKNEKAEDCLDSAFGVIEFRKGLISETGDFVRYAKLSLDDQSICDMQQGNDGNEYFLPTTKLKPENFKRD